MDFDTQLTDDALLKLIGERLARLRLAQDLTQGQVAGLGLRTVQRLELGATATRLTSLLRICRVLDLMDGFDILLPEETDSPIALLKLQGRRRKRATGKRKTAPDETKPWTWGDAVG